MREIVEAIASGSLSMTSPRLPPSATMASLAGYEKPEDLLGEAGLFKQLKRALLERALGAELDTPSGLREERSCRPRDGQQPLRDLGQDGRLLIATGGAPAMANLVPGRS
jgi:putative transposase